MRSVLFMPLLTALATCVPQGDVLVEPLTLDASEHTDGFECAGGCETAPPMVNDDLSQEEFLRLRDAVAQEPVGLASLSLETLLFHGEATAAYLDFLGPGPLRADQVDFLRQELRRTHVQVSFRVVDEEGFVHASLSPTEVPLGKKQHVHLHTEGALGDLEAGGTVRRVGLNHVWSRW